MTIQRRTTGIAPFSPRCFIALPFAARNSGFRSRELRSRSGIALSVMGARVRALEINIRPDGDEGAV
jgi:hypothetical protein